MLVIRGVGPGALPDDQGPSTWPFVSAQPKALQHRHDGYTNHHNPDNSPRYTHSHTTLLSTPQDVGRSLSSGCGTRTDS
jgi:hypothetical protein